MMCASRIGAWAKSGYTAGDYVQDGLIAMWDGIENAGWGVHDSNANIWIDLIGGYDLTVPSALTWGNSCLMCDGKNCAYNESLPHSTIGTVWTCECVYTIKETGSNYKGLFGCRTNVGGGGWLQIYGINYWTNMKGGWSLGNGNSTDITISGNPTLSDLIEIGRKNYVVVGQRSDRYLIAGTKGTVSVEKLVSTVVTTTHSGIMLGRAYESPKGSNPSRSLLSDIYQFRLYNKTLTSDEIAANYAIDKARFNLP